MEQEMLSRLINVELKIDRLLNGEGQSKQEYSGHPDQAFGHTTYAQHGEDLALLNIFHTLGIAQPSYIDIGAHHPINISNTALLYARGSRGINVEANPDLIAAFDSLRLEDTNLNVGAGAAAGVLPFYRIDAFSGRNTFDKATAEAFVSAHPEFTIRDVIEIRVMTLNEIIDEHAGGRFPNLLSIDVEGLDYAILAGADFSRSRPDVICAEVISGDGVDDSARIKDMLAGKGFVPLINTIGNVLFVADTHRDRFV